MDEIGRGTSTYDGLALAYASAHYLAQKKHSFTLFATHYFELTQLENTFDSIHNIHLGAIEHGEKIVFLHQIKEGCASQSYGIQVAALAGVPKSVIQLAKEKLLSLEADKLTLSPKETNKKVAENQPAHSELEQILSNIDPDQLSPREALDLIYQLALKAKEIQLTNSRTQRIIINN
jgi:DNA mismatch repair protein MutS